MTYSEDAFTIRDYFVARCHEWKKQRRVTLGGFTFDSLALIPAVFGLCHRMCADGKLNDNRGRPRSIEGRHGLAEIMGVSKPTAQKMLAGLEAEGLMSSTPVYDDKGYHRPSERCLLAPGLSKGSNATFDLGEAEPLSQRNGGPKSTIWGSKVNVQDRSVTPATGRKRGREEETYTSGDTATPGDVSHQGPLTSGAVQTPSKFWEGKEVVDGKQMARQAIEQVSHRLPLDRRERVRVLTPSGDCQWAVGANLVVINFPRYDNSTRGYAWARSILPELAEVLERDFGKAVELRFKGHGQ